MSKEQPVHPIWAILEHQGRTLAWLAKRIGYSESHIWNVKGGRFPASAAFRAKCAEALDLPEHVLFVSDAAQPEPASTA